MNFFPNLKRFSDLKDVSDEELVAGFKKGKKKYYEELYKKYYKLIYGKAYKNFRNEEDAKEITNKTFFKASKGIKDFRGDASFKTWLFQILRNLTKDKWKSQYNRNKKKTIFLDDMNDEEQKNGCGQLPRLQIEDTKDFLHQICSDEGKVILKKVISGLNDTHREVIELFFSGLTYKEISEKMNIPFGTVQSRISNARKKVITTVQSYYQDKKEIQK